MDLLQVGKHYDTEAIATTISELLWSQPTSLSDHIEDSRGETDLPNSASDDTNTSLLESSGTKRN
jgi:hypothetical protein